MERILRRGKFQEAEDFARAFHLNLETVYKAHLQKLSIDIQPWSEGKVSVVDSGILFKKLLRKVEVFSFTCLLFYSRLNLFINVSKSYILGY